MSFPAPRPRPSVAEVVRLLVAGTPVELIDGELVYQTMARPERGMAQAKVIGVLDGFNRHSEGPRGPGGWWLMTEVDVLYGRTEEIFRHDALDFRRARQPDRPTGTPVEVLPDWVCEVLSTSTARADLVKKHRTLHLHGVDHYWIVDPEHETLTVYRHHSDAYRTIMTGGVGDIIRAEPFEAVEIDVGELFGKEGSASAKE